MNKIYFALILGIIFLAGVFAGAGLTKTDSSVSIASSRITALKTQAGIDARNSINVNAGEITCDKDYCYAWINSPKLMNTEWRIVNNGTLDEKTLLTLRDKWVEEKLNAYADTLVGTTEDKIISVGGGTIEVREKN